MMGITAALVATLALSILAAPLPAEAQQPAKVWRIGLFHVGLDHVPPSLEGLRDGLKALGYEEGKNLRLDFRNLPNEGAAHVTAKEFVRDRVDLIVAFENQTVRAAKAATTEIPIVFLHATDPVDDGFVKSLAHPGGNLTGFSGLGELPAKRMELFKELVPGLRRLLVLTDPDDPTARRWLTEVRGAATALKLRLVEAEIRTPADLDRSGRAARPASGDGIFVLSVSLATNFTSAILRLGSERRVPVAGMFRTWVEQGALFSYAPNFYAIGRDAARHVDKLLKGAKPADLPVEQVSRFEFLINLKTAKALGLTIPPSVLIRAD